MQLPIATCTLLLMSALLSACVSAPPSESDEQTLVYGGSRADAIEVCKAEGALDYLTRLRCPMGQPVSFLPVGTAGPRNRPPQNPTGADRQSILRQANSDKPLRAGETDYHTVNAYDITCSGGTRRFYFDHYHCGQGAPLEAPRGYQLLPPLGSAAPVTE